MLLRGGRRHLRVVREDLPNQLLRKQVCDFSEVGVIRCPRKPEQEEVGIAVRRPTDLKDRVVEDFQVQSKLDSLGPSPSAEEPLAHLDEDADHRACGGACECRNHFRWKPARPGERGSRGLKGHVPGLAG